MKYELHFMSVLHVGSIFQPGPQALASGCEADTHPRSDDNILAWHIWKQTFQKEREGEILVVWHNLINKRQSLTQRMYRPASETYNQYRRLSRRGSPSFVMYYYDHYYTVTKITSYKNKKVWSLERSRCGMSIHERDLRHTAHEQPRVCGPASLTEGLQGGEGLPRVPSHSKGVTEQRDGRWRRRKLKERKYPFIENPKDLVL